MTQTEARPLENLPDSNPDCAIAVQGVQFAYSTRGVTLDSISFVVQPGERVGLVGANGCGKTTLLLLLCGALAPSAGQIRLGLRPLTPGNFYPEVGFVFQNPDDQLFCACVCEDVAFGVQNLGLTAAQVEERVARAMAQTEVAHLADRPPHHLSGGEKKRVAIAGILAMQPQLMLLDEPTAQLDPRSRRQLIQLLHRLPQAQIIATHDLDLTLELCSRTIILSEGKLVYDGDTASILSEADRLEQYALEAPLSYRRAYCNLDDRPSQG
jgi:cobalt/nickel transport system ATP-binding protein